MHRNIQACGERLPPDRAVLAYIDLTADQEPIRALSLVRGGGGYECSQLIQGWIETAEQLGNL